MTKLDRDLENFNAGVLADLGQARPRRHRGLGGFVLGAVAVAGVLYFGSSLRAPGPEQLSDRQAIQAPTDKPSAVPGAGADEAARHAVEKDADIEREVRAEFLAKQIARTKEALEARLRDPGSATYRNVIAIDDGMAFCGEVNAANGFGGYAGWTPFISVANNISFPPNEPSPMADLFERSFDKWCRNSKRKAAVDF